MAHLALPSSRLRGSYTPATGRHNRAACWTHEEWRTWVQQIMGVLPH
jgi:hypothetical protein